MKITRPIFLIIGFLAVGLGVLGSFLPVLPTTPFLLLALYCFSKSSDRFYNWLRGTALYKKYLLDYVTTRSMTLKQKLTIMSIASVLLVTAAILVDLLWVRVLIIFLIVAKSYYFIFRIKTRKNVKVSPNIRKETSE